MYKLVKEFLLLAAIVTVANIALSLAFLLLQVLGIEGMVDRIPNLWRLEVICLTSAAGLTLWDKLTK